MSIESHANRFVCDLVAYEPGKPIEETARELGLEPDQIVKVASNENPLGPSPLAVKNKRTRSAFVEPTNASSIAITNSQKTNFWLLLHTLYAIKPT